MTKKIDVAKLTSPALGTQATWYKLAADMEILNNTGNTEIRVDKAMIQASCNHNCVAQAVIGFLVHFTDETGAALTASITNGTTDDAALETLLNQWKDNVFMTDFRWVGTGVVGPLMPIISLEANTKRILKPGQKMLLSMIVQPGGAETTKYAYAFIDSITWYSAAAQ